MDSTFEVESIYPVAPCANARTPDLQSDDSPQVPEFGSTECRFLQVTRRH